MKEILTYSESLVSFINITFGRMQYKLGFGMIILGKEKGRYLYKHIERDGYNENRVLLEPKKIPRELTEKEYNNIKQLCRVIEVGDDIIEKIISPNYGPVEKIKDGIAWDWVEE